MAIQQQPKLKRTLSLTLVTFYGVGTILGAGIYVLIGHVAGEAGRYTSFAFLTAALIAGFSAFSYAELVGRYPQSAGEAIYIDRAFNWRKLSILIGLCLALIGLISTAVLVQGFYGYLNDMVQLPKTLSLVLCTILLGGIVAWGISQSVWIAALITVVEMIGLLIIIWVGRSSVPDISQNITSYIPGLSSLHWQGIFMGAFIAFYAFIGFEDMVNVAEEVRNPTKNLPRAIILALFITSLLYIIVSIIVVTIMPPQQLAESSAPLADVFRQQTGANASVINIISLLSLLNGALVQLIMASRILYGMGKQGWISSWFGTVHAKTQTPVNATIIVTLSVLVFVTLLPLISLAKLTSFITLSVFVLINLALLRLKQTHRHVDLYFTVPVWVPVIGVIVSVALLGLQVWQWVK